MVFVVGVGLDGGEDLILADKAGDVVHVAVRVVAGAAAMQPDGLVDAEVVVEGLFQVTAGRLVAEAGVALLDFTEEALFSGEEDSCAIGVDAAAFEDDAMVSNSGLELGHVVVFGDVLGNLVVATPVVVFGPGVELPVGDGDFAGGFFYKDWAGVAEPDPIRGPLMKVEAGEVSSGALEQTGSAALGGEVVDEDVHIFDSRQVADDLAIDPGNGLKFSGPVFGVMGPGDPGGGVGSPLGGHAVILVAWCRHFGVHLATAENVEAIFLERFRAELPGLTLSHASISCYMGAICYGCTCSKLASACLRMVVRVMANLPCMLCLPRKCLP